MGCVEAQWWWGQVGKDVEVGRSGERQQGEPGWVGCFSECLVTLFTFQPFPGSQGLAEKTGRKWLLPPGTPCGPLSRRLDLVW